MTDRDDVLNRLAALLDSLRRYHDEEHAQGQQEDDERRRAWHDGRASAYGDVAGRLEDLLSGGDA
jgi:hypothetical protein